MPKDQTDPGTRINEFFARDPEAADRAFFGREPHPDRRGFRRKAGLAIIAAMVGTNIPFHRDMPMGRILAAFASEYVLMGKDGLALLNDRPVNAETPVHLLDHAITPTARHVVRNNGIPPESTGAAGWELTIDGLIDTQMKLRVADLKSKFEVVTRALVIERGGNGRAFLDPPAKGNQGIYGAAALLCTGAGAEPLEARLAAADPEAGEKIFRKCKACHTAAQDGQDRVGPNLWGAVDREVAAAGDFGHSDALKADGGRWTPERLDAFLVGPKAEIHGTKMGFAGLKKAEDRTDVIAWLNRNDPAPRDFATAAPAPGTAAEAADYDVLAVAEGVEEAHATAPSAIPR